MVALAAIMVDDKILLVKRSAEEELESGKWGLVGGAIEPGEDVGFALRREAAEELGIDIEPGPFIGTINQKFGDKEILCFVHICSLEDGIMTPSAEVADYGFFDRSEAFKLPLVVRNEEVLDAVFERFK